MSFTLSQSFHFIFLISQESLQRNRLLKPRRGGCGVKLINNAASTFEKQRHSIIEVIYQVFIRT